MAQPPEPPTPAPGSGQLSSPCALPAAAREEPGPLHTAAQHLCLPGTDVPATGTAASTTLPRASAQPPLLPSTPPLNQGSHLHLVSISPATLNAAPTHPLQYCPIPSMSPQCPQLSLPCPACTMQSPLSLAPDCAVSAAVPERVRQDTMPEIQLLEEKPRVLSAWGVN